MSVVHIYRATRGKYKKPIPILKAKIKWIGENEESTSPPKECRCGHPKHWEWGNGTRNGHKLWYPLSEMYYQVWHLTKKEMAAALKEYDMASLEVPSIILCRNCYQHELKA